MSKEAVLNRLYNVKRIRQNYERHEKQQEKFYSAARAEQKKIKEHFEKKATEVDKSVEAYCSGKCSKTRIPYIIINLIVCITVIVGTLSFLQPVFSPGAEHAMEAYDKAVENDNFFIARYIKDNYKKAYGKDEYGEFLTPEDKLPEAQAEYENIRYGEVYVCLIGVALLFFVISVIVVASLAEMKYVGLVPFIGVVTPIYNLVMVVIFFIEATKAVGFFNALIGGLVSIVAAIPFIFFAGYSYVLPIIAILISSIITSVICSKACTKVYEEAKKSDPKVLQMYKEKKELLRKSKDNATAAYNKIMEGSKSNPYDSEFFAIKENYLTSGNELYDIIWALENDYATTIVEARKFLDQRRRDAQTQKLLERNAKNIADLAQAEYKNAEATRALANRPVEVKVTVEEYYL